MHYSGGQQPNARIMRRRPQTTKRLMSTQHKSHNVSHLGLKKNSSILSSVQQDAVFSYNEAALMKATQN